MVPMQVADEAKPQIEATGVAWLRWARHKSAWI